MSSSVHKVPKFGWLLYDDPCGFCRGSANFSKPFLLNLGYDFAPLQSDWVCEHFKVPGNDLLNDVRLLLPDETLLSGADVYRHIMQRIWWTYPIYLLSCTLGFRQLFNLSYRTLAANRLLVSKACGLKGEKTR